MLSKKIKIGKMHYDADVVVVDALKMKAGSLAEEKQLLKEYFYANDMSAWVEKFVADKEIDKGLLWDFLKNR